MVTAITVRSIEVTWSQPPPTQQNGLLTHYTLVYQCRPRSPDQDCDTRQLLVPASKPGNITAILDSLYSFTVYSITVSASTGAGTGPFSFPITVETSEGGLCVYYVLIM